jgi:hypothetical protein
MQSPVQKYCLDETIYGFTEITFVSGAKAATVKYSSYEKIYQKVLRRRVLRDMHKKSYTSYASLCIE